VQNELRKLILTCAACLSLTWMSGCAGTDHASECAWAREIVLAHNFEVRLRFAEKLQIAQHNAKVAEFCR